MSLGRQFSEMRPATLADPSVLYHGTSSIALEGIRRTGIRWTDDRQFTREAVERVVSIFDAIDWAGEDQGGWFVLKGYTLGWDFSNASVKPVYLAESFHRACLYAQRDWAGGETARGIRHSLTDLRRLASDKEVYDRYLERLRRRESVVPPATQLWLSDRVRALGDIAQTADELYAAHQCGVVVAVRLADSDLPYLKYHEMHGVMAFQPLPPDRIVDVEEIPPEYRHDVLGGPTRHEQPNWDGIIAQIRGFQPAA